MEARGLGDSRGGIAGARPGMSVARDGAIVRRVTAGAVLAVVIAAGLVVHAALPDTAATDIAGDLLYAVAAYAALIVVAPRLPSVVVGAVALAWCVAVELLQLTGIPFALGVRFPPAMLVLGTVFDPRDLLVYAAALAVATTADLGIRSVARRWRSRS